MKKIEFFSTIQGVAGAFPIIPAKDYMPKWVPDCRDNYKQKLAMLNGTRSTHTYRCPGIFDILRTGYYVTLPWDLTIETRGDGQNFKWIVPDSELAELMAPIPLVLAHSAAGANLPNPPGSMQGLVKINTPWNVKLPKGVKLMMLPLSYTDVFEYAHVPGILDPGFSTELSLMLRWFKLSGTYTIKAGTPLCHLIPITDENLELECRDANDWDRLWVQKKRYLNNMSFFVLRNKIKEAYNKHWGGNGS